MIRKLTLAAGFLAAMIAPAFADCAEDIARVEQALAVGQVSEDQRATVESAVTEARAQIGNEEACQAALAPALEILGENPS